MASERVIRYESITRSIGGQIVSRDQLYSESDTCEHKAIMTAQRHKTWKFIDIEEVHFSVTKTGRRIEKERFRIRSIMIKDDGSIATWNY